MNLTKYFNECEICKSNDWELIYNGEIRAGGYGSYQQNSTVTRCKNCGVGRLAEADCIKPNAYETEEYRATVNQGLKVTDFYKIADPVQIFHLKAAQSISLRGKLVADIGCGAGSFSDYISGIVNQIIAIEPTKIYQDSLIKRGYKTFDYTKDAFNEFEEKVDFAVSFQVIEHVENPVQFLQEIFQLLKPGGKLLIATPNSNDVMLKLMPLEFKSFFYRKVHRWYFDTSSLSFTAKKAGFIIEEESQLHTMNMSNMLSWLSTKKPTGNNITFDGINRQADTLWSTYLEQTGQADTLFLQLSKPK